MEAGNMTKNLAKKKNSLGLQRGIDASRWLAGQFVSRLCSMNHNYNW